MSRNEDSKDIGRVLEWKEQAKETFDNHDQRITSLEAWRNQFKFNKKDIWVGIAIGASIVTCASFTGSLSGNPLIVSDNVRLMIDFIKSVSR